MDGHQSRRLEQRGDAVPQVRYLSRKTGYKIFDQYKNSGIEG